MQLKQTPIAVYLLSIPLLSVLIDGIGGHDVARIAQILLGLSCSLLLVLDASKHDRPAALRLRIAVGLVLLLALASTLRAPDVAMAARELAIFSGMVAIALVVAQVRDPVLTPSTLASAASAAYIVIILMIFGMAYLHGQPLKRADLFIGYDSYRFFNHVQTASLPLAVLALTVAPQGTWLRRISWLAACGGFALLFATAGRGTLVGIALGALAIGVLFGRTSFATLRTLAVAAALGLAVFALLFWALPGATGAAPDLPEAYSGNRLASDQSRFFLWRIAIAHIEHSPWLGIGPMHYAHYPNLSAAHPHNIYLQTGAEWGLPMLFLVVGLGVSALRKLAQSIRRCAQGQQRDCGVGLFLACTAIAVDGLFSGNFVMPASQVWIAFTLGWASAWAAQQNRTEQGMPVEGGGKTSVNRIVALGLLVSQLWLVWSVWPEARHLAEHYKHAMEQVAAPKMHPPRFWSHGWF